MRKIIMSELIEVQSAQDVETRALLLFDINSTNTYKITVLYLVYKSILLNPNITLRALKWILNKHGINKNYVVKAVFLLSSDTLFGSIHTWSSVQKTRNVKHYKVNVDNELMTVWMSSKENSIPELENFNLDRPS
jgi:hypothetical protein